MLVGEIASAWAWSCVRYADWGVGETCSGVVVGGEDGDEGEEGGERALRWGLLLYLSEAHGSHHLATHHLAGHCVILLKAATTLLVLAYLRPTSTERPVSIWRCGGASFGPDQPCPTILQPPPSRNFGSRHP